MPILPYEEIIIKTKLSPIDVAYRIRDYVNIYPHPVFFQTIIDFDRAFWGTMSKTKFDLNLNPKYQEGTLDTIAISGEISGSEHDSTVSIKLRTRWTEIFKFCLGYVLIIVVFLGIFSELFFELNHSLSFEAVVLLIIVSSFLCFVIYTWIMSTFIDCSYRTKEIFKEILEVESFT